MRHMVIASHAHFAAGISVALSFLGGGAGVDIKVICAFVDGANDIAQEVANTLAEIPEEDEVLVCTDIFGGSVNNEFTNVLQKRENIHLVTNMNLPLLISLVLHQRARSGSSDSRRRLDRRGAAEVLQR